MQIILGHVSKPSRNKASSSKTKKLKKRNKKSATITHIDDGSERVAENGTKPDYASSFAQGSPSIQDKHSERRDPKDDTGHGSATTMTTRSHARRDDCYEIEFVVFISPEFQIDEAHCQIGLITSLDWNDKDRFLSKLNIIR